MRVRFNTDLGLKIARFKGVSPNITNKVDLQPYLSFDDVCNLTTAIEKQLKGRKPFLTLCTNWSPISTKGFLSYDQDYPNPH